MKPISLAELFPDEDYRHSLKLQTGVPAEFFRPTAEYAARRAQRAERLRAPAARYAGWLPGSERLVAATAALACAWGTVPAEDLPAVTTAAPPGEQLLALGRAWEHDFLLLRTEAAAAPRLVAGVVCFPSSWALEEKLGHDVAWIHEVVPGLNAALRAPIDQFLKKLRPGVAFCRHNWGLSRWPQLDQHPALHLPRLAPPVRAEEVWLRLEYQALVALPEPGGVLFGINVRVHPLTAVLAEPEAARRLHRAIATMPEAMARYKNILAVRDDLLRLLAS